MENLKYVVEICWQFLLLLIVIYFIFNFLSLIYITFVKAMVKTKMIKNRKEEDE